jgi:hypothetical protein
MTVNDIQHYSSHNDLAICWITRDSGFAAYGGDWFGMRTDVHISREEFEERDSAPWPEPTASTIVAERTIGGVVSRTQGSDQVGGKTEQDTEPAQLVVPHDSEWAKRLLEIFNRRLVEGRKTQ